MKKLATLFTDSYKELRSVRTITTAAMFAAISVVLGYFTLEVGGYLKIGFSSVANEFVYYLFGPAVGGFYGAVIDLVKYVIKPTGAYFPGFTFNAILGGIIYGIMLYKKPLTFKRVLITKLVVVLVCNVMLNTLWVSMLYGKAFMLILPARALKNAVMWPIDSLLFFTIAKAMEEGGVFKLIRRRMV